MQVYAPTSDYADYEVGKSYADITSALIDKAILHFTLKWEYLVWEAQERTRGNFT